MKKIAVVPTLLTLGNGICGFAAITYASKINSGDSSAIADINFAIAGWFIFAAMLFDMLDGYIARLSRTASRFGGELDSLCDAISFGVAPAFLLLKIGPGWDRPFLHRFLAGIAALYMVCAILRLARFNVENSPDPASHKRFRGLPSPGAAGCLASLAILRGAFPGTLGQLVTNLNPPQIHDAVSRWVEVTAPIGALVISLLMVSRLPYPHVTKKILRGRRHLGHLVQILLAAFVILLVRELALVVIFWAYALAMPVRYILVRSLRREPLPAPETLPR